MNTIHKFVVPLNSDLLLMLPHNAEILTFQVQDSTPTIWVLLDSQDSAVPRRFKLYGTGHRVFNFPGRYVGTIQLDGFVWHLFDEGD